MRDSGDLDGLIPFLLEHQLCIGALDAHVEKSGPHLARVWVTCAACDAYFERRFTSQPAR